MIRFAPQAAKPPVATQAKAQPAAASDTASTAMAEPLAGLLADLDEAPGARSSKAAKPRVARKPKAGATSTAVQLDLDA